MRNKECPDAINMLATDALAITRTHEHGSNGARGQGPGGMYTSVGEYHLGSLDKVWVATQQDWHGISKFPDISLIFRTNFELLDSSFWLADQIQIDLSTRGIFRQRYSGKPQVERTIVTVNPAEAVVARQVVTSFVTQRGINQLGADKKIRKQSQALAQELGSLQLSEIFKYNQLLKLCTPDRRVHKARYNW